MAQLRQSPHTLGKDSTSLLIDTQQRSPTIIFQRLLLWRTKLRILHTQTLFQRKDRNNCFYPQEFNTISLVKSSRVSIQHASLHSKPYRKHTTKFEFTKGVYTSLCLPLPLPTSSSPLTALRPSVGFVHHAIIVTRLPTLAGSQRLTCCRATTSALASESLPSALGLG